MKKILALAGTLAITPLFIGCSSDKSDAQPQSEQAQQQMSEQSANQAMSPLEVEARARMAVLEKMMDEGDPKNFKTDGYPKAAAVNKALGRTVDTDAREAAWESILNS